MNYYNEFDPKAAAWLRELIKEGHIPNGEVDTRSIVDVQPADLRGFTQCHFFAGIGGWSLALQLAGWSSTEPVWTGSCPCQPFSVAGKGKGTEDERHLWPVFAELIRACKPPVAFGEQVASKAGREWLAGVFADLERMGYSRAGADLCAAGVGAPHIRQRLYWVADARSSGTGRNTGAASSKEEGSRGPGSSDGLHRRDEPVLGSTANGLAHSSSTGLAGREEQPTRGEQQTTERGGDVDGLAYSGSPQADATYTGGFHPSTSRSSPWSASRLTQCRDGKARRIPVEPELFPLAHGVPNRVGLLRGSGNAIVPQVAAQFISAFLDA